MKKTLYIVLTVICFIVTSCKSVDNEEVDELNVKLHQLQEENNILNKKYTKSINENNELLIEIHNLKARNVSLVNEKEYLEEYYNNIVFRFDKDTIELNNQVINWMVVDLQKDEDAYSLYFNGDESISGKLIYHNDYDTYILETKEINKLPFPYYSKIIPYVGLGIENLDELLMELGDKFYDGIKLTIDKCVYYSCPVDEGININYKNIEILK
ncbi:hypothetical protein AN1V17_50770 [Vallitalea sediminicola]